MNETNNKAVVDRVRIQLQEFYDGDPWVTQNFKDKVLSIEPTDAFARLNGHSHTAAQLVSHMTAWRNFAVQKLTGNDDYDIEDNSEADWPVPDDWEAVCAEFETSQKRLLAAIDGFPLDGWSGKVPKRNYSFLYMINGIVQHDYYHSGQIGSLLAGIKKVDAEIKKS